MGGVRAHRWRGRRSALAVVLALRAGCVGAADPPGTLQSRAAVAACQTASERPAGERGALLDRTLQDAEAAVAAADGDALAHFAIFCALGKRMQLAGVSMAALLGVRRLRREIDRTLELAPDFADALAGKGALLIELPRLLGGDAVAGERLLRRALEIDAAYLGPRLQLAESLLDHDRRDEARHEAQTALAVAERKQSAEDVVAARKLLDRLAPP